MVGLREVYEVTDTNSRGLGIVKGDGKVIFVDGAVAGDVCSIEITGEEKNYLTARIKEILSPSKSRVEPDCPYFGKCGGCSLRHVLFDNENEIKRNTVSSAFRRAGINDDVEDTLCCGPERYRNKVSFKIDGSTVGFYETETNNIVPLENNVCINAPDRFSEVAALIAEYLNSHGVRASDITIRSSTGGELSVLVTADALPDRAETTKMFSALVSSLSFRIDNSTETFRIFGKGGIDNSVFGLDLFVSDGSFFQVNYEGAELLFGVIASLFDRIEFDLCADLFCGTGVWGLALAKRFPDKHFYGVDSNASAIEDAKKNAERNGIKNIRFYCGDASMRTDESSPDAVIVDPPRAGLQRGMLDVLMSISPKNVVYVSCNPFTLARDVKILIGYGYSIKRVTPVNLFPRTEHVETVVSMTRI